MDDWEAVEREAFRAQEREVNVGGAAAGAVVTTGPLIVGAAIGDHALGLLCALGGLNTALAMSAGSRRGRAAWGGLVAVSGTVAVGVATLTHEIAWVAVLATLVWSTAWALWRASGPDGVLAGFVTTAVFIIVNGLGGSPGLTGVRMLEFGAGAAVALGVMVLPAPRAGVRGPGPIDRSAVRRAVRTPGPVRRHALRVGVVTAASTALYRALGLEFGYWVPLTAVAVLQPDAHNSRVRAVQRAAGTVVGTVVVAVVAELTSNEGALIALVFVASGGLFALRDRSYYWFVMLLTPTALLMLSTVEFSGWHIALTRIVNTAVGIVIAVVAIDVSARIGARRSPA